MKTKEKRILVVEDDQEAAAYLRKGLTESGHAVVLAEAGREGLERAVSENFDALIIDRMLPGLDGLSIVASLRAAPALGLIHKISQRQKSYRLIH